MAVNDRVRHESKTVMITDHLELGYNYRMTDVQAAIGIKQLEKLDWVVSERRKIAQYYHEALRHIDVIRLPLEEPGYFSNYQSYSVYLKPECKINRDELMQKMLEQGIATRSGIMTSHRETAYRQYVNGLSLPVSEEACDRSIIIPLYVPMTQEEMELVVHVLKQYLI